MRAQMDRAAAALCMGRGRKAVLAELALAFFFAGAACCAACIFMAMEPLS